MPAATPSATCSCCPGSRPRTTRGEARLVREGVPRRRRPPRDGAADAPATSSLAERRCAVYSTGPSGKRTQLCGPFAASIPVALPGGPRATVGGEGFELHPVGDPHRLPRLDRPGADQDPHDLAGCAPVWGARRVGRQMPDLHETLGACSGGTPSCSPPAGGEVRYDGSAPEWVASIAVQSEATKNTSRRHRARGPVRPGAADGPSRAADGAVLGPWVPLSGRRPRWCTHIV
jgi:hypothetical protein